MLSVVHLVKLSNPPLSSDGILGNTPQKLAGRALVVNSNYIIEHLHYNTFT